MLLTIQYLDEADQLADEIVVLDAGRVIARGTSDELERQTGGQVLEVRPADPADLDPVAVELAALAGGSPSVDRDTRLVGVPVDDTALVAAAPPPVTAPGTGAGRRALSLAARCGQKGASSHP